MKQQMLEKEVAELKLALSSTIRPMTKEERQASILREKANNG